ncbi:homeobox protein NANOG-like [Notechis scutatus]|uniref:Homeobox protein NANOG-like n=1 Tax=Notechis scutatus TaxID=8663 RepID=A0A6J1UUJ7_9SAUR|nr:homeobox protein NANOG-like [Notechis scutatus]
MNAPLAINTAYRAYTSGVAVSGMGYEQYYWPSPEEKGQEPVHSSEGGPPPEALSDVEEKAPHKNQSKSPRSPSSGILILYTPDSATSPNRQSSSPQLSSTPQKYKEENPGSRKVKTRTAFSQEQLEILHHRFQSQKYLSPQQIQELAAALKLTYKQVKTWFQNQRMKFKRTQKETLWMRKGMCQIQNSYLDINPSYHEGYSIGEARNIHSLAAMHENYTSNQNYSSNHSYNSDHHQVYSSPQNFYPVGEDGSFFGKAGGACYSPQTINYINHQKMNFYPGFSASMEYATMKMEDGYTFQNASSAALPGPPVLQRYQSPLQTQGPLSN